MILCAKKIIMKHFKENNERKQTLHLRKEDSR